MYVYAFVDKYPGPKLVLTFLVLCRCTWGVQ